MLELSWVVHSRSYVNFVPPRAPSAGAIGASLVRRRIVQPVRAIRRALHVFPLVIEMEQDRGTAAPVSRRDAVGVTSQHEAGQSPMPVLGLHNLLVGRA